MEKVTCKVFDFNNPNRRLNIPKETFQKALDEYLSSKNQKLGELDPSPEDPFINLSRVSHKIEDMRIENDEVIADIQLLDTLNGKLAQKLIKLGNNLHFEPRMIGECIYETDESGNKKMVDVEHLQIISIDIV